MLTNKKLARFVQISSRYNKQANPVYDYYQDTWPMVNGYHIASPHFLEVPTWIASIAGKLGDSYVGKLEIVTCPADLKNFTQQGTIVFGSVLDANKDTWLTIVEHNPNQIFYLGGYVSDDTFKDYSNVTWVSDPYLLSWYLPDFNPQSMPDYELFRDYKCIPRLQMSSGCLYRCAFCTVGRKVVSFPREYILGQVESFKPLQFELIYLDDKTFGQADNWKLVNEVYDTVKAYNPSFKGFIVQTTAHEVIKNARQWVENYHVKVIEIGVESLDQKTLNLWHKPHGVKHINKASETIRQLKNEGFELTFIPNFIFGIASDDRGDHDYSSTLDWIRDNLDIIALINPYLLCQYHDSKGSVTGRQLENESHADQVETEIDKSWLTPQEQKFASLALDTALWLTLEYKYHLALGR